MFLWKDFNLSLIQIINYITCSIIFDCLNNYVNNVPINELFSFECSYIFDRYFDISLNESIDIAHVID